MIKAYRYPGKNTCAADSLCSTRCPVGIDTGKMIKVLREEAHGKLGNTVADWTAGHFDKVARAIGTTLNVVDTVHEKTGTPFMESVSRWARTASLKKLPLWNKEMPTGAPKIAPSQTMTTNPLKVVYFPSCASRAMGGPSRKEGKRDPLRRRPSLS